MGDEELRALERALNGAADFTAFCRWRAARRRAGAPSALDEELERRGRAWLVAGGWRDWLGRHLMRAAHHLSRGARVERAVAEKYSRTLLAFRRSYLPLVRAGVTPGCFPVGTWRRRAAALFQELGPHRRELSPRQAPVATSQAPDNLSDIREFLRDTGQAIELAPLMLDRALRVYEQAAGSGRVCAREGCDLALPFGWSAVYCTNECARLDA